MSITKPKVFNHTTYLEDRGSICSFYRDDDLFISKHGIKFLQDRFSVSYYGTVRGLHGDPLTHKYVTCPIGSLFLVVVNPITQEIYKYTLSEDKPQSILIPAGMLNGHQCLTHHCLFLYKQSHYYEDCPASKQWTVKFDDPTLDIKWPLEPMRVSHRDLNGLTLKQLQQQQGW